MMTAAFFVLSNQSHAQWILQSIPGDAEMLLTTDFYNSSIGAAAGLTRLPDFSGRAVYTTNGGLSWAPAQIPDSARSLVTVSFVAPDTAYIAGAYNLSPLSRRHSLPLAANEAAPTQPMKALGMDRYLRRIGVSEGGGYKGLFLVSTNAGMTWDTKGKLPDSVFYMIGASFVNTSVGYVTVDADPQFGLARILKTTDAGDTWIQLTIPDSIPSLRNITFLDSLTGIAVGYQLRNQMISGIILRTSDAGSTWHAEEFPTVDNFTDVYFLDSSTGFAVGVYSPSLLRGAIFKTTDAGLTWSPLNYAPDSVLLEGVRFAKETTTGIVYGETVQSTLPFVARTTDEGFTWTEEIVDSVRDYSLLIGGKLLTPLAGYLCGGDGFASAVMLHTTNGGITAVQQHGAYEIREYALPQNYPNPFNPTTRITFSTAHRAYVTIKIFTLLGVEVATIVSDEVGPANYAVDWNAGTLPSGVYFYRMQAGAFSESRKLLLIK